ncbi:MAG: hypothetical protein K0M40_06005 [Prolixibacteraceae bacterium]|nr:hypothetical protein [Prolixibacteraceae bacterium]
MKNEIQITIEMSRRNNQEHNGEITEFLKVESEEKISYDNIQISPADQLDNELYMLIGEIKTAVHQLIYLSDKLPDQKTSNYISSKLNRDYSYLNKLFVSITGISIKKYISNQKIELVKEILFYDETDLFVIARKLQFRSVSQLENKFIKQTGVSTAFYRLLRKTSAG